MSILVDEKTKVVVQGATGNQGAFHTQQMLEFGTRIVAGVAPGREGQDVHGVPVYDTVEAAVEKHGANAAVQFVPAAFARDAAFEALDAGIPLVVILAEHVPLQDAMDINALARQRGATIIGPNTYGLCSPGERCKLGLPPNRVFKPGPVGVVARSGTLSYEIVNSLSEAGLGQTTVVGMGGDRLAGVNFVDVLRRLEKDEATQAVVLIGEIGGTAEEEAAEFIKGMSKPVVAYLAGKSAPPGKRMGHAGALISGEDDTAEAKLKVFRECGLGVSESPATIGATMAPLLGVKA